MSPQKMHGSVISVIISKPNSLFDCYLNASTKDVSFCHLGNHFNTELSFFSWNLNVPTKNVKFCHICNHFDNQLSFSVEI